MGRGGIDAFLYLLDEAFRGRGIAESDESQALLRNLATVSERAWTALPGGAVRSVASIALHVGSCKLMYVDYAFGAGTLEWGTPDVEPWPEDAVPPGEVVPWLELAHGRLVDGVSALRDDEELDRLRMTNWGERRPTRWIIASMVTHDAYHAGEINHIRSLLDGDDRWRFVKQGLG